MVCGVFLQACFAVLMAPLPRKSPCVDCSNGQELCVCSEIMGALLYGHYPVDLRRLLSLP